MRVSFIGTGGAAPTKIGTKSVVRGVPIATELHPARIAMSFDMNSIPSQAGRLAIVTGANAGLGFETTRYLAQKGMSVVMACRSEERARTAKAAIEAELPGARLQILQIDLGDLSSVRRFAESFRKDHQTLDLLINNAGIMWTPYARSVDGFESQMAANYFGHFLLTSLLLDLMPDCPESRVVTLSSIAHAQPLRRIRFEDIHWERGYNRFYAYAQTKLACLLFAKELQRRLKNSGRRVLSLAAHPGVSETELVRSLHPALVFLMHHTVTPLFFHPPREAALPTLMAALDANVSGGEYFGPQGWREMKGPPGPARQSRCARDDDAARRLWEVSEQLTGARFVLPG
jgi:NAD(P)-dependent dehydrogenase (short-subunit alcohol dehydrogenase family)